MCKFFLRSVCTHYFISRDITTRVLFLSKYTGNKIYYTVQSFLLFFICMIWYIFLIFHCVWIRRFSLIPTLFRESSENLGLGLKRCSDTKAIVIDSIKEASLADRSVTIPANEGPVRIQFKCLICNLIHSQNKIRNWLQGLIVSIYDL